MSAWRPTSRVGILAALLLVPIVAGTVVQFSPGQAGAVEPPPNIVLILTDDQRADTLQYMPIVQKTLGKHGVTFTNAYVSNPVCCPSRATIMTGLYSHSTGVYNNDLAGGFNAFEDDSTIATWLQAAGYRTGLFGKYLNGYESDYTPPGWDRWFATHESGDYYDYSATSDGTIVDYGNSPADYGTSVVGSETMSFIRDTAAEQPLFAYVSLPAPHEPAIPAPGDQDGYGKLEPWRPPSYNERDVKDKPEYIRNNPWFKADRRREVDRIRARELRTLPAVDRVVGDIVDVLRETGRLENTLIVFTSDNGVLWGEHRWAAKDVPYEESIAVPLIVRWDAVITSAHQDPNLVTNLDYAPTFADVAGADPPEMEGASFFPLLLGQADGWRSGFLIEHMASHGGNGVPSYCGYHTRRYVLVRYNGGDGELYDLRDDPWQRDSVYGVPAYAALQASLNEQLLTACVPKPPGLTLVG